MRLSRDRLRTIEAIPDESLDYSDIPEADANFWLRAELQMPQPKKRHLYPLGHRRAHLAEVEGEGVPDPHERHPAGAHGTRSAAPTLTTRRIWMAWPRLFCVVVSLG